MAPETMLAPLLPISGVELAFLRYLASRVDVEVVRAHRGEQGRLTTLWNIRRLAALAEEILGEAEVAAWLEASTLAPLMVDQVAADPILDQGPAPCVWHWQPKWDPD